MLLIGGLVIAYESILLIRLGWPIIGTILFVLSGIVEVPIIWSGRRVRDKDILNPLFIQSFFVLMSLPEAYSRITSPNSHVR